MQYSLVPLSIKAGTDAGNVAWHHFMGKLGVLDKMYLRQKKLAQNINLFCRMFFNIFCLVPFSDEVHILKLSIAPRLLETLFLCAPCIFLYTRKCADGLVQRKIYRRRKLGESTKEGRRIDEAKGSKFRGKYVPQGPLVV